MKKTAYLLTITFAICAALLFSCGGGGGGADNAIDDTSFTMGYNSNGAESGTTPAAQSGNGKAALAVSANTGNLSKNGYLFDGWNTQPDGYGADYAPGSSYTGKKNITLYAKWARLFNYNVNQLSPAPALDGAQRAPGNPTATITGLTDRGQTLSDITIPRTIDGYTVAAIGDNAFQGCTNVANMLISDTVTDIGDNAFNGCSNLSGVTMQGTVPPTLGTDAFAGCVLLAVSVPQSAASAYNASPTWSTVTILAPGTFSIIYNGNGSDGGIVPARQVGMVGININVYGNNGSLTRAGCTFNGWNDRADGTGHSYAENAPYPGPDNMTLYAQWAHPDYIVTFDDQGADIQHVSPATITVKAPANTIGSLPSTPPQKNGYYFAGWNTRSDGTGDTFVAGSQVISDKTVYAKWIVNDCTISYDRNNATDGTVPESHATQFNNTITLHMNTGSLERTGYRFDGWNTEADGTGTDYAEGANYTVTGDATLYAKWLKLYTITYDSNGATSGVSPDAQIYAGIQGEQITLRSNTGNLERDGYKFLGWNTKADGSGTYYRMGASFTLTGDAILYAHWRPLYTSTPGNRNGVNIGDIVLADGKTCSAEYYKNYSSEYNSNDGEPVGVVAYQGRNTAGVSGTWYMVQLDFNSTKRRWCESSSVAGYDAKLSTSYVGYDNTYTVIGGLADYSTANYPAFGYCIDYHAPGTASGDTYYTGWFLPSSNELSRVLAKSSIINSAFNYIKSGGGSANILPQSGDFWSSTESEYGGTKAIVIYLGGNYVSGDGWKITSNNVVAIRALDD